MLRPPDMTDTTDNKRSPLVITKRTLINTDILVIGGGMAGAFAAVTAKEQGLNVVLVDKGTVGRSGATPWAGAMSVFDKAQGDDRQAWSAAASRSSDYVNNLDWLEQMMDNAKICWNALESWGMFEPDVQHPSFVLRDKLLASGVLLVERNMITSLLTEGNDERVIGAMGFSLDTELPVAILAKATIMAAGAGSFKAPGFPIHGLTNDGDAMAYRIGARISGKEWMDFHFTFAEAPASCRYQWGGMWDAGINQTHFVFPTGMTLDDAFAIHTGDESLKQRPGGGPGGHHGPSGGDLPGGHPGGPPRGGPPKGAPPHGKPPGGGPPGMRRGTRVLGAATGLGIHKAEGIWPTSMQGASDVPGLFAAGDALASMLCGASYIGAGISLSSSATQGVAAAQGAVTYAQEVSAPALSEAELDAVQSEMYAPRKRENGFSPAWITQVMQNTLFPYFILLVKHEERMQAALSYIMFVKENLTPRMTARDAHDLKLAHETENMLLNAEMKLRASLARKESRGTHYREDYPARDDENWLAWIMLQQDENGDMTVTKEAIPEKWRPDQSIPYEERYPTRFPGELEYLGLE